MQLSNHHRYRRQTIDIKMTPMIDVVFLLLVFFVWTASFGVVERLLPSNVASASGARGDAKIDPDTVDFEQVVVRIQWHDQQPSWLINHRQLSGLDDVRATLSTIASIKSDLPVVVDPQEDVPLGFVIDVYDTSRQVGFSTVHFTAPSQ